MWQVKQVVRIVVNAMLTEFLRVFLLHSAMDASEIKKLKQLQLTT